MPTIFLVHWNEAEAQDRTDLLTAAGYSVRCHWSQEAKANWGDEQPDFVVISLDRLPSHGRAIAEWVWAAKKRQSIPIIFSGGKPDKVQAMKEHFPRAHYCSNEKLVETLAKL